MLLDITKAESSGWSPRLTSRQAVEKAASEILCGFAETPVKTCLRKFEVWGSSALSDVCFYCFSYVWFFLVVI